MLRCFVVLLMLFLVTGAQAQTQTTSTAVEGSHIFCTKPCQLYGGQVNNTNAASRWIMLFDATTDPGDGAVVGCTLATTARPCVMKWYQTGSNATIGVANFFMVQSNSRLPLKSGLVAVCSSTGPFVKTETADCVFSFEVQ